MNKDEKIFVTKPSLAEIGEIVPYLEQIWESGIMTHNGPLVQELERRLCEYLDISNTVTLNNGTLALQLAIRALGLRGEIITTPFTFVATADAIIWENCTPVFVDIQPDTLNIDPERIEAAITPKTVAIMPVHVFSRPCDIDKIQTIAEANNLKVIYDAAHAMCVTFRGKSIMNCGDISCTSFHATKLYNTCEGGACFSENADLVEKLRRLRFFGFDEAKEIVDDGMNAKMTEISAGLGLANLKHIDKVLADRREKYQLYMKLLEGKVQFQAFEPEEYNYSYMPVLLPSETKTLEVLQRCSAKNIFPRRYFYPCLHKTPRFSTSQSLPVAEDVASRILSLPLYFGLEPETIERICGIISEVSLGS